MTDDVVILDDDVDPGNIGRPKMSAWWDRMMARRFRRVDVEDGGEYYFHDAARIVLQLAARMYEQGLEWVSGDLAMDAEGQQVRLDGEDVAQCCALGAIRRATVVAFGIRERDVADAVAGQACAFVTDILRDDFDGEIACGMPMDEVERGLEMYALTEGEAVIEWNDGFVLTRDIADAGKGREIVISAFRSAMNWAAAGRDVLPD